MTELHVYSDDTVLAALEGAIGVEPEFDDPFAWADDAARAERAVDRAIEAHSVDQPLE